MVVILLVIAVFGHNRQQKRLVQSFLEWQQCGGRLLSESPSRRGHSPPRAATLLGWVHPPRACLHVAILPQEAAAAPKEMLAMAKPTACFLCSDHSLRADNEN